MPPVTASRIQFQPELVQTHQLGVWRYLRFLGCDAQAAEELKHETFTRLWQSPPEDRGPAALAAWLRRTALNLMRMQKRAMRSGIELADADELIDLEGCQEIPYTKYAALTSDLPRAFVSHSKVHIQGELRLDHPPYDPRGPHAERQLRTVAEFARERGLAVISVDVQKSPRSAVHASDGSRGSQCTVGPASRVLQQGRADYQWNINPGQTIVLYPQTDLQRVMLLHFYGGNWIETDARIEQLVRRYLRK